MLKIGLSLLAIGVGSSRAALVWGFGGVGNSDYRIGAGVQVLPLPFIGGLGIEGTLDQEWNQGYTNFSGAMVLRDLHLPLTDIDLFGGLGERFRKTGTDFFAEAGFRMPFSGFINALGVRLSGRAYTNKEIRFGVDLEVRL